jgi:uncharacterized protein (TIGR03086 family)
MELLEAHGTAMARFDQLVTRIGDADWAKPTPCTEWTVRDLLNHLVAEQLWVPDLLAGATVADVGDRFGGDVLGDDPAGRWQAAAKAAREAWLAPGAVDREVHLSYGTVPATQYGWEMTADLAVHGWDLAHGIGAASPIDPPLADALLDVFTDQVPQWQGLGIFAPPVAVAPDADSPTRLVALLGRQP